MPRDTLLDFFHDFAVLRCRVPQSMTTVSTRGIFAIARSRIARGRLRHRLREQGIGKDDKVILYGENRLEWIVALWGCLLEGVL